MEISGIDDRKIGTSFQLVVFNESSLIQRSLIPIRSLEEAFTYNIMNTTLLMFYFNEDDIWTVRKETFSLTDLLKDCEEVKEYAKQYFPEFSI